MVGLEMNVVLGAATNKENSYGGTTKPLKKRIGENRPFTGHGPRPVRLSHNNATPHIAKLVRETLMSLGWEVLWHPAYSPDLAPSNYHLFRSMNKAHN